MAVALFATCLVDLFRPAAGFAAARLLESAGCTVVVPPEQTCCGQPAFNSGARGEAAALARQAIAQLEGYAAIVVPSGSCAGTIVNHYPDLLADDSQWAARAQAVAAKTWELTAYLHQLGAVPPGRWDSAVTHHDSCSCRRELGVIQAPRSLLGWAGTSSVEPAGAAECCGFGGTFAVKYPEISGRMVDQKAQALEATGAATVVSCDLGCLMNVAGRLRRRGSALAARHIAEVLADQEPTAPIASAEG